MLLIMNYNPIDPELLTEYIKQTSVTANHSSAFQ